MESSICGTIFSLVVHVAIMHSAPSKEEVSQSLDVITDYRMFPSHHFSQYNRIVAEFTNADKVDIQLCCMITDIGRSCNTARRIPVMVLEGTNHRIVIHVNEQNHFGISHHEHRTQKETLLLQTNTHCFPKQGVKPFIGNLSASDYTRYHIQVIDLQFVFVNVGGCTVQSTLKQQLFPNNEVFRVRLDGPDFPVEGSINGLYIRAKTKS